MIESYLIIIMHCVLDSVLISGGKKMKEKSYLPWSTGNLVTELDYMITKQ